MIITVSSLKFVQVKVAAAAAERCLLNTKFSLKWEKVEIFQLDYVSDFFFTELKIQSNEHVNGIATLRNVWKCFCKKI